MINREKVIKGFECCLIYGDGCNKCTNCPYLPEPDCIRQNKRDALALLKEQDERIKKLELEKGWDESPDMMGKW